MLLLNILSNEKYYTKIDLYVVKLRYKYLHTYGEIGSMLGFTPERIRQILINIICKTRFHIIREKIFNDIKNKCDINPFIQDEYDDWYHTKIFDL